MQKNYMMNANDVADELGVSKGHAYKLIRQLNEELETSGYLTVSGKIPRAFWEKKFYGYQNTVQTVNGIIKIPTFGGENSPLCYA